VRLVSCSLLAEWLHFDTDTLRRWVVEGKLDAHKLNAALHHSEASINSFLACIPQDDPPLTVADFRNGTRLITSNQVAEILEIKPDSVLTKLRRGRFKGLGVGRHWRFVADSVWAYKAKRDNYFTREDVMRTFGCSTRVVDRWRKTHILEPIRIDGGGQWRYFYRPEDILRVVTLCLPRHAKHLAKQWLDDVRTSHTPPLTSPAAMEYLGLSYADLKDLRRKGGVFHLTLTGGKHEDARFTIAGLQRTLAAQKAWTPQEIDHVIGGGTKRINQWLEGSLACKLHDHRELDHRFACVVYVITPLLSPGLKARVWLAGRNNQQSPLISDGEAAAYYGVSVADVALLAERGTFAGLKRPDGVWMFTPSRLEHTSHKKMERLLTNLP
jgi:hypothetical protein